MTMTEAKAPSTKTIEIIKPGYSSYAVGDVARFDNDIADALIEQKIARLNPIQGEERGPSFRAPRLEDTVAHERANQVAKR